MTKKKTFNSNITLKKGAITALVVALIGALTEWYLAGNVQIANALVAGLIVGSLKMMDNFLKHKDL